jgi:hypothetical protein
MTASEPRMIISKVGSAGSVLWVLSFDLSMFKAAVTLMKQWLRLLGEPIQVRKKFGVSVMQTIHLQRI